MNNTITTTSSQTIAESLREYAADATVYMCIGTSRVLCDSLGPRVGQMLNQNMQKPIYVYGLDDSNITADNLVESYQIIKVLHPRQKIVVVDAGVGATTQVGRVQVGNHGICPGAATNKSLPYVGDISIVGIVASKCMTDFYQSTASKQSLIDGMVDLIASGITLSQKSCSA